MRKVILTLAVMLAIVGLLLTANPVTQTASCEDCDGVRATCGVASAAIYNACIAGGASVESCAVDEKTWYRNCVRGNGCTEKID